MIQSFIKPDNPKIPKISHQAGLSLTFQQQDATVSHSSDYQAISQQQRQQSGTATCDRGGSWENFPIWEIPSGKLT